MGIIFVIFCAILVCFGFTLALKFLTVVFLLPVLLIAGAILVCWFVNRFFIRGDAQWKRKQ